MLVIPMQKKATLEILVPLLISLFLIQVYFGRNKNEPLGWNTAYANSIVLLFVTAHLATYVFEKYGFSAGHIGDVTRIYKILFVGVIALLALSLILIDFFHSVNKKISFFLSSSIFITFISFVSVVLVYSDIPFDKDTLFSSLFLFIYVLIFFKIFRMVIPASPTAMRYLRRKKEEREEERKKKIRKIKKKITEKEEEFVWSMEYFRRRLRRFFNKLKKEE